MSDPLDEDYARAGFGNRLGFGERPALVVVDFVRAYLDRKCSLYAGVEAVRDACVRLLERAREATIPVFHTNVEFMPGGANGGVFYRKAPALKHFERGSPFGEFAEGLEPRDDEIVITKQYGSAFFGTPLASLLTAKGVDTLLIAGLSTSGCVRATAVDTVQHGFVPVVVADAVGDRDPGPHESNLFDLQAKYADVVALGEVEDYLRKLRG